MDSGILRSDMVSNDLVQDRSRRIQVIGSDVESLYPSLEAVEVAEIVYKAMLETKVKFENIDYMEACKYIVLTSKEQEDIWRMAAHTGSGDQDDSREQVHLPVF